MKLCPACKNTYPDNYQTCPLDQSSLAALGAGLAPGMVLRGKYEVLRQLGTGGMATVYQVRHLAFHEIVAIKVVHAQLMHDPDFIKRFRNEAVVARRLKHPNAVRVEDFDSTEDGRPFIVMEFVDGHGLDEVRRRAPGPWPVDRCLSIASQAAAALGAAHALGIVHRDVKPANILLLGGDRDQVYVKVLDFGIAKVTAAFTGMTSVLTEHGFVVGTVQYMSPEQATGGGEAGIDGRSDLYSLGLVLYEMLTGAPPFRASSPVSMLMQQINTVPPPPESISAVPPAISALVLKTLSKSPSDRFQSAAEMLIALRDPEAWHAAQSTPFVALPVGSSQVATSASEIDQPQPIDSGAEDAIVGSAATFAQRKGYALALCVGIVLLGALVWAAQGIFPSANKPISQRASEQSTINKQSSPAAVEPQPSTASPSSSKSTEKLIEPRVPIQSIQNGIPQPQQDIAAKLSDVLPPTETPAAMYARSVQLMNRKLPAKAVPLMKGACDGGNAAGCRDLGFMYQIGWIVRENKAEAVALYKRACSGGDAAGCRYLGNTFEVGDARAIVFYRKACDGGDAWGCRNLGSRYDGGYGIAQDKTQAALFYRKACDGDDSYGCDGLARLYENGTGVAQSLVVAIELYQKACKTGWSPACDYVKKISQ